MSLLACATLQFQKYKTGDYSEKLQARIFGNQGCFFFHFIPGRAKLLEEVTGVLG